MNQPNTKSVAVVVNDDPIQLNVLAGFLGMIGIQARAFESAEAALATMDPTDPPNLIVTDLYMPGIDGWRFCRLLRSPEYAAFNKVPILVVSATFADCLERITDDLGVEAFLPVPVDGKEFTAQARTLLAGKEARRLPRALIVEDGKTLAGLLQKAFAAHGYRADTALSVAEAKAAFAGTAYDVAVLDYHLPDGSGDALLDVFRAGRPDCVCLMMTTDPTPELALDWMKRGAAAYLRKPFEPDYLIELCARARRERALLRAEDLLESRTQDLRKSEAFYHILFESVNDAILVHEIGLDGMPGKFIAANRIALERLGYTREDLLKLTPRDIAPDDAFKDLAKVRANIASTGTSLFETVHLSSNGRRIPVESHVHVLELDGQRVAVSVVRDLSERKRAEDELANETTRRRILMEQSRDGIVILDRDGRVYDSNQKFADMLGYSLEEMNSLSVFDWEFLFSRERVMEMIRTVDEKGDHFETQHRRKDGTIYDVEISSNAALFAGQKLIFCVCRDITERKQAEEKLRASEAMLSTSQRLGHVGSWVLEHTSNRLIWSNEVFRIFGIEPQAFDATYEAFLDRIHPDDRSAVDAAYTASLREDRDAYEIEHRIVRRDTGEIRHVHERCFHERDAASAILRSVGMVQDITEQKQLTESLRESRNMLDHIFNIIPQSIFWKDRQSRYLGCNMPFARTVGLGSTDAIIGKTDFDLPWPREEAEAYRDDDRLVMDSGMPRPHIVEPLQQADGSRLWVDVTKVPLTDDKGDVYGVLGVYEDVTDRKRAEEELLFLGAIAANMSDSIVATDTQFRILYINHRAEQLYGYTIEELRGQTPDLLNAEPMAGEIQEELYRRVSAGEVFQGESLNRRKDGSTFICEYKVTPLLDDQDKVHAYVGVQRDVTEAHRQREALLESEERLRVIADATTDLLYEWDIADDRLEWFGRIDAVLGYESGALERTIQAWAALIHPEDAARLADSVERHRTSVESICEIYRVRRKDGAWVWWEDIGTPILDADGWPTKWIGSCTDITERKQAEKALRENLAELERMNRLMVGRENRMIELKVEVNELCRQGSLPERYAAPHQLAADLQQDKPRQGE